MSQSIPKSQSISIVLCALLLAGCGDITIQMHSPQRIQTGGIRFNFTGEKATRHEEGRFANDATAIIVENRFGDVTVVTTEETPRWEWELTCWANSTSTAEKYASSIKLETSAREGEHSWKLVMPPDPFAGLRGVKSNLSLFVPKGVRVDLQNSHGNSKIEGVTGNAKARCSHGNLELSKLVGEIDAENQHGNLNANQIGGGVLTNKHGGIKAVDVGGALKVASAHGNITLENIRGNANVTNSFGRVRATNVTEGLSVRNEHGEVVAEGITGMVDVSTSFARLELRKSGDELRVRNRHGSVIVDGGISSVDAATSFGSIEIESPAPQIRCRNEHGQIRFVSTGSSLKFIDAQTSFGNLDVRVPAGVKPVIEAGTTFGNLDSDFPVLKLNSSVDNFAGLDESAPRMTLRNSHGNIRIKR